jgi:hypothetical protein
MATVGVTSYLKTHEFGQRRPILTSPLNPRRLPIGTSGRVLRTYHVTSLRLNSLSTLRQHIGIYGQYNFDFRRFEMAPAAENLAY